MAIRIQGSLLLLCLLGTLRSARSNGSFTLVNNCQDTVWIGAQSNAGIAPLSMSNVMLSTGKAVTVATSANWGGRFWGRTGCVFGLDNTGSCVTGDCGGKLQCQGTGGKTPATLVEVTLAGADGKDFYDVSLVDGYNLPLAISPNGGGQGKNATADNSCNAAGCTGDLNLNCPQELRVTGGSDQRVVGCRSACEQFGTAQYCCRGANSLPTTCQPTDFSKVFKQSCPKAYSYAYDDQSSLFTCRGGQYTITFCPTALSNGDAVQFPEAQAAPTASSGDPASAGASNDGGALGTNFRIITPSKGEPAAAASAASSFLLLLVIAVWQF